MRESSFPTLRTVPRKRFPSRATPLHPVSMSSRSTALARPISNALSSREVLAGALHELHNQLQTLLLGLDLMQTDQRADFEERQIMGKTLGRLGQVLQGLREFYFPPERVVSSENLAQVVEEVVQPVAQEWERAGRTTRVLCRAPLTALP